MPGLLLGIFLVVELALSSSGFSCEVVLRSIPMPPAVSLGASPEERAHRESQIDIFSYLLQSGFLTESWEDGNLPSM